MDFNSLGRDPSKKHSNKFEANPCSGLREEVEKVNIS